MRACASGVMICRHQAAIRKMPALSLDLHIWSVGGQADTHREAVGKTASSG